MAMIMALVEEVSKLLVAVVLLLLVEAGEKVILLVVDSRIVRTLEQPTKVKLQEVGVKIAQYLKLKMTMVVVVAAAGIELLD